MNGADGMSGLVQRGRMKSTTVKGCRTVNHALSRIGIDTCRQARDFTNTGAFCW